MITKRLTKVENEAQLKRDQRLKSVPPPLYCLHLECSIQKYLNTRYGKTYLHCKVRGKGHFLVVLVLCNFQCFCTLKMIATHRAWSIMSALGPGCPTKGGRDTQKEALLLVPGVGAH
jgi:hypothetical protein